ncbi:MAG: hypothetical protein ACP5NS_01825 [Candidatus Pacearchaeota archaeon]
MPTEEQFVGLDKPQVISGKKQLLYMEMELLTSLQKYERYKKLRKEEMAVKNLLKKVIIDMKKEMDLIIQYMPQIKVGSASAEALKGTTAKRDTLEEEIQSIRRKIANLSSNQ